MKKELCGRGGDQMGVTELPQSKDKDSMRSDVL